MLVAVNSLPSKTSHYGTAIAASPTNYAAPIEVGILGGTEAIAGHVSLGTQSGDLISVVLSNGDGNGNSLDLVTSVSLLGHHLTISPHPPAPVGSPSPANPPAPGEFQYSPETQTITINPGFDASGLTITYTAISAAFREYSAEITNIPSIFKSYRVIEASFNTSFGGHPSGSFKVMAYANEAIAVRIAFAPGTPLVINNIGYRVKSLSESVRLKFGESTFTVNLQGYWEKWGDTLRCPLDKPVRVRSLISNNDCSGFNYTAAQLGGVVGVGVSGLNFTVRVPRDISDNETITLRSLLEDSGRLLAIGAYVRWENLSGPEIVRWDSPTIHVINSWEINELGKEGYPEIAFSSPGMGADFGWLKLTSELSQANLTLDQDPSQGTQGDKKEKLVSGDKDPENPPKIWKGWYYENFNPENLKSLSWCFDVNGKTQKRITKWQENGTDLEETEETYGFAYTSLDVYEINDEGEYVFKSPDVDNYWQLVKEIKTKYDYDEREGYFLKKSVKGKELMRILKETADGKEAIALQAEIAQGDNSLIKQRDGYTNFFWHPIDGLEEHTLEDLTTYYKDLKKQDPNQTNYVVPRFSSLKNNEENSFLNVSDPRSTSDNKLPDIVIGKQSQERLYTTINSTNPEKYLQWNPVTNQQGTNFDESAGAEALTENAGRPPIQNRKEKQLGCHHENTPKTDTSKIKYLASTPGAIAYGLETQTISYTSAYDLTTARLAVTTDYQIKNSQACYTVQLPLGRDRHEIRPGDAVSYQGILWRVFSSDRSWKLGRISNLSSCSLSLGQDVRLSVSVEQING